MTVLSVTVDGDHLNELVYVPITYIYGGNSELMLAFGFFKKIISNI